MIHHYRKMEAVCDNSDVEKFLSRKIVEKFR